MSTTSYSKMKVDELKAICTLNGLKIDGLKKAELIEMLKKHGDSGAAVNDTVRQTDEGGEMSTSDEREEEREEGSEESDAEEIDVDSDDADVVLSPQITELKLRLKLVALERIKQKEMVQHERELASIREKHKKETGADAQVDKNMKGLLPCMDDESPVEFFCIYEKTMQLNDVPKEMWAKWLPGTLTSRASQIYSKLSLDECKKYSSVKTAILDAYKLNAKRYYQNYATARRTGIENNRMFLTRLQSLQSYYLDSKAIKTFEQLKDDNLSHRLLETLNPESRSFVEARRPSSSAEIAELADLHFEVQGQLKRDFKGHTKFGRDSDAERKVSNAQGAQAVNAAEIGGRQGICASSGAAVGGSGFERKQNSQYSKSGENTTVFKDKKCDICLKTNHNTEQHNFGYKGQRKGQQSQRTSDRPALVRDAKIKAGVDRFIFPVYVNGKEYRAFRDSGCNYPILINAQILTDSKQRTAKTVNIAGVTGNATDIPIFEVQLQSPKFGFNEIINVEVGAVRDLQFDIIIGNRFYYLFPNAKDILQVVNTEGGPDDGLIDPAGVALPVTTRRQAAAQSAARNNHRHDGVQTGASQLADGPNNSASDSVTDRPAIENRPDGDKNRNPIIGVPRDAAGSELLSSGVTSEAESDTQQLQEGDSSETELSALQSLTDTPLSGDQLTRGTDYDPGALSEQAAAEALNHVIRADTTSERRDQDSQDPTDKEFRRLRQISPDTLRDEIKINATRETEFARAQQNDRTLEHWRRLAENGHSQYVIEDGLLYKIAPSHVQTVSNKQLCVPSDYRKELLRLAHNSLLGAHLGRRKVVDRLQALYAWPRMREDVARHISRCETCQKVAPLKTSERVPLQPIARIPEPYADISFDIVGPALPLTTRKNRYVLLHVDNATRHVQMIAMKNMRVDSVADALMSIYTQFGVPLKCRFDQSTVNMGHLMTALRARLGIQACPAAVHVHRASCIAERHIRTASEALKKFLPTCRKSWDINLKYLTWALNETVSEATGFAPSELLFGRLGRGPLHVLRDWWICGQPAIPANKKDVLTYLDDLRQTLQTASDIAQSNADKQQDRMKAYYDRQCTDRTLTVGQEVLLLMRDSPFKMEGTWTGPMRITRVIDRFNYEVQLDGRRQTYHINMLRPFRRQSDDETSERIAIVISPDDENDSDSEMPTVYEYQDSDESKKFNIGENLTAEQKTELLNLLNSFPEVFTSKTGRTDMIEHKITLLHNRPCKQAMYKIPHAIRDQVEAQLNKLLEDGVIEESQTGGYSAPLVCVKKRNGEIRLCCNYSRLNDATAPDDYPMPDCAAILNKAAGSRFISTIDLKNFYFQIPLCAESQPLTAFDTEFGRFHWKMAPQGLKHSGKSAQRLINKLLRSASRYSAAMQDDICVFSSTWSDHIKHVTDILMRLKNAGLTANTAKCQWVRERVQILGHELYNGTVAPSDEKIKAVQEIASISNKKKLQSWVGLCNYYRDHIQSFSEHSAVLTELLKKKVPEDLSKIWKQQHQRAFETLREALISKPILRPPHPDRQYILQTDACNRSIGFILSQIDEDGREYVVSYGSRKLKDRETRYSTIEQECLALVTGALKFEQYIYGKHVIVHCDHQPLSFLSQMENNNSRLMRWSLILQRFDLEIKYRKSCLHGNADAISRL